MSYQIGYVSSGIQNTVSYSSPRSYDISNMIAETPTSNIGFQPSFEKPISIYESNLEKLTDYKIETQREIPYHPVEPFLAKNRQTSVFIGSASEIEDFVKEAFTATTDHEFPDDILIRVLSKEDFKKANQEFGGIWNEGIQGFAINRKKQGLPSEVFVRKGELDRIMITLGHEIGHVLTKTLDNHKSEEAKAFAFSIAWMKKIKEFNIANLSTSICLDNPAQNGIHDVALDFVLNHTKKGIEPISLFKDLGSETICIG